jgi:hypothetical protein
MTTFKKTILFTDTDGYAKFREEDLPLPEGTPQTMLSALYPSSGYQLRQSPVGFRSQFHCTTAPQWLFVLSGQMEIGLQDGSSRIFGPGEHWLHYLSGHRRALTNVGIYNDFKNSTRSRFSCSFKASCLTVL